MLGEHDKILRGGGYFFPFGKTFIKHNMLLFELQNITIRGSGWMECAEKVWRNRSQLKRKFLEFELLTHIKVADVHSHFLRKNARKVVCCTK